MIQFTVKILALFDTSMSKTEAFATEMELIDQSETINQPLSVDPTGDNELDWVLVRLEDLAMTVARERGEQLEKAEEGGTDQMTKAREDQVG